MEEKIPKAKAAWLGQGLKILEREGPSALSIDNVAKAIGKTKGSFYFHFKNRDQFIEDLLNYFQALFPVTPLSRNLKPEDTMAYVNRLLEQAFNVPPGLEIAIRAWSQHNEAVKAFQDRTDKNRIAFSLQNYINAGYDEDQARIRSIRAYAIYIGLQQLRSLYSPEQFKKISETVFLPLSRDVD